MKVRIRCWLMLICMLAVCVPASATEMLDGLYTDVPSVMTQDAVLGIEVKTEEPEEACAVELMQPDKKSMALLEDVYDFVWRRQNRPVRFYDEETQQKIQALAQGVDIDVLHMTEFMAQTMSGVPTEEVTVERLLDVEYVPGQLVIVVLGYEKEDGEYRWLPYLAEVPSTGLIRYVIPKAEYDELAAQDQVIYHVLTDRIGGRGEVLTGQDVVRDRIDIFSKEFRDIIRIRRWRTESGETIDDLFSIFLVERTREMNEEIDRIAAFLSDEEADNRVINWFPEEMVSQAQLLLGDVDRETLITYDIVGVMAKDYRDTYGDVATENLLATAYSPDHKMVVMLGFPLEAEEIAKIPQDELDGTTHFEWYCLRAESVDELVEIVFKQLVIPRMETEPAMMVVLSEPLDE